jgi:predicted ATPase
VIRRYDPDEYRPLATRFGQDIGVASLSYRSLAQWLLGYPQAALADADRALKDARAFGHAATLMYALAVTPFTLIHCGGYTEARAQLDEVIALADRKGAVQWKAVRMMHQGWLLGLSGNAPAAAHTINLAVVAYQSTGATLLTPWCLSNLAKVHADLGRFDDAWRCIDEAMRVVKTTQESWCGAEVNRIAGEIVEMPTRTGPSEAEAHFRHALAIARAQQAKSWELRAAMSMARLLRDQGKRQQARDLLAPVYSWFTEGLDTLDLKEAKILLNELA